VSVAPGGYGNGGCRTITLPSITQFYSDGTISTASTLRPLGLALDVAVSSDGAYVAIAEPGAITSFPRDTVELIPRSYIDRTFKGSQDPAVEVPPLLDGHGPGGAECLSYRSAGDAYQVTSVAFDGAGKLYAFSREPASLQVYSLPEQDGNSELALEHAYDFAQPSVFDTGHALFHGDVGSGLSCASCHGEALDDGHVWNFVGVGPRRTQNIRGGLMSTLPLHWGGDLPTFKSLVDEVMTRRMSGFALKLPYSDALASWIDGLPPVKLAAQDDEAAARGKALFESDEVGCASCHSGAHLTNNASYDVGTGGKFQVPTLNGLALHAPFLHDGCAATLAERFDPSCGGGDKHGHTSHLTQAEISDLLAYLQTL
jgi:mono/diheme cytochrome c family protein